MSEVSRRRVLFWSVEILVIALILFVCQQLKVVFRPVLIFISVVFVPLIISLFLYYALRPVFRFILKLKIFGKKMPRGAAAMIIVLGLIVLIAAMIAALIPPLVHETMQLIKWMPHATAQAQDLFNQYAHEPWFKRLHVETWYGKMDKQVGGLAKKLLASVGSGAGSIFSAIANATVVAVTVPVMVYYMLKDGQHLVPTIQKAFVSDSAKKTAADLLYQMSNTLSSYIAGQAVECFFVAVATTVGYLIIGQPMAIVLGIIAGLTNMIPYLGPYLGIFPALFVALTVDPKKIIWIIIVVVIVQQVDGNLIYPKVIGKSMNIHPLTIIVLLLAAGNIAGIAGMILCVPLYGVLKTIVIYFHDLYRLSKEGQMTEKE